MTGQAYREKGAVSLVALLVIFFAAAVVLLAWLAMGSSSSESSGKKDSLTEASWVQRTDVSTGISYKIPSHWLQQDCSDACSVSITNREPDVIIQPMSGPTPHLRYDSVSHTWQTINPATGEVLTDTVAVAIETDRAEIESAVHFTGGHATRAQTHIFIVYRQDVYQLSLPATVGSLELQEEKILYADEFLETVELP